MTTARFAGCVRLAGLALALLYCTAAFALTFPSLTGRVVDEAGILDAGVRASLAQKLADLETKSTTQLVVVTLKSLQGTSIEDYGYQLGRNWQIGQKGKNNGALLIVAPNERKVRIEVGYGLEGTLTDAVTKLIIENSILPRFRANDFAGGITRGADDIIAALSGHADEYKQRAAKRPDAAPRGTDGLVFLTAGIVLLLILLTVMRGVFAAGRPQRRRRGLWGLGPVFFPVPTGSSWGSGSGWDSGSSGGGFSGGGGSFGGGGSSGSW